MLLRSLFLLLFIAISSAAPAAERHVAGVLGNSGESGDLLVTFMGDTASGMGPVIDEAMTSWERGGRSNWLTAR